MLKYAFLILSIFALTNAQFHPRNIEFTPYGYVSVAPPIYYDYPQPPVFRQNNPYQPAPVDLRAIVKIDGANVRGNVTFYQQFESGPVVIEGTLIGLPAGEKGFHIHQKGDITGGCLSAGPHFNPANQPHGGPEDHERHVGDLGNVLFGQDSIARIRKVDHLISLSGPNNIIGRTLVVHVNADDLGKTDHNDSKTTGNAGGRAGCGVVGVV